MTLIKMIFTDRTKTLRQSLKMTLSVAAIAVLSLAGCSKSQPASEQPAAKAATISIDPATAGTISGVVSLKGLPPKMKPLDMTADPGCPTGPQPAEVVVANAGKLANVFVYVKEGLPQGNFAVPSEPVVLDQKSCRYNPHVLAIMAGQPLKTTSMTCQAIIRRSMNLRCPRTSRSSRNLVILR
jgi:hypothetical protein